MLEQLPIFSVCGFSNSGKTSLILALIRHLRERDLGIVVVKHCGHGPKAGDEGKDSDKFFAAGAEVVLRGPQQGITRTHPNGELPVERCLQELATRYDVILVEGHKTALLPNRIWLLNEGELSPPEEAGSPDLTLGFDGSRLDAALEFISRGLARLWLSTPVYAGVLIGGTSGRMGEPKHLLKKGSRTWLEHIVATLGPHAIETVILGRGALPEALGDLPRLPDAENRAGPVAGMVSAMRWRPWASWLFVACDQPLIESHAIEWLLGTRAPGVWATLPQLAGNDRPEPLLAHYDFRALPLLASLRRPGAVANHPKTITPAPPSELAPCWRNFNTADDVAALRATHAN